MEALGSYVPSPVSGASKTRGRSWSHGRGGGLSNLGTPDRPWSDMDRRGGDDGLLIYLRFEDGLNGLGVFWGV